MRFERGLSCVQCTALDPLVDFLAFALVFRCDALLRPCVYSLEQEAGGRRQEGGGRREEEGGGWRRREDGEKEGGP